MTHPTTELLDELKAYEVSASPELKAQAEKAQRMGGYFGKWVFYKLAELERCLKPPESYLYNDRLRRAVEEYDEIAKRDGASAANVTALHCAILAFLGQRS